MKTKIKEAIENIEGTVEYIQSEDYANNYADFIPDSLQYYSDNVKDWLETNLKTPLTPYEIEHLEYILCYNDNHKLIFEDGIEHDPRAILTWNIGEKERDKC